MKFVAEIDELFGARRAGYVFDETADRERDEELYQKAIRDHGENWVDGKADELWELDGSLFRGEDGEAYAVVMICDGAEMKPLFWHRLCRSGEPNA